jgi:hypothetical protein
MKLLITENQKDKLKTKILDSFEKNGVYKTFEQGWPANLVKKPVQVMLLDDKLEMRPISIT